MGCGTRGTVAVKIGGGRGEYFIEQDWGGREWGVEAWYSLEIYVEAHFEIDVGSRLEICVVRSEVHVRV